MKFVFYCQEGSPSFRFIPPDLYGRGLGGAEYGLISLAETLASLGHKVRVFNQPPAEATYNGVEYIHTDYFDPFDDIDVFVVYRNPVECIPCVNARLKLHWSTDQFTTGNYPLDIWQFVDHIVTISPYHKSFFLSRYGAEWADKITSIDLGVRTKEYSTNLVKIPQSFIYCSVPDRGLQYVPDLFRAIVHFYPDASLHITSDYSLWVGEENLPPQIRDRRAYFRNLFANIRNVHWHGALPREQLVRLQLESEYMLYPNTDVNGLYELFCVSLAECQVAGAIPLTSKFGALETTTLIPDSLITYFGHPLSPDDPRYYAGVISRVHNLLNDTTRTNKTREAMRQRARQRFDWANIATQWLTLIRNLLSPTPTSPPSMTSTTVIS